jgi:hypothetical protein
MLGDLIMNEIPFLSGIISINEKCEHCFEGMNQIFKCDTCNKEFYCSIECKNNAWKEYHSIICIIIL